MMLSLTGQNLHSIVIEALESQSVVYLCGSHKFKGSDRETKVIPCRQGTKGRILKIRSTEDKEFRLCEFAMSAIYGE